MANYNVHGETKWNVYRTSDDRYLGQIWALNEQDAIRGYCADRELTSVASKGMRATEVLQSIDVNPADKVCFY